ncbi:hypothetical protein Hanom_Chr08g00719801 [Helianthus anomalus]
MASNKNDIHVQFSKLTQSEIDQFCADYDIDLTLETQVPGDRTANECLAGFLVVSRKFSEVLNEKEPGVNDLDQRLLLMLRAYRSKLRAYPEELLVMLGISQDWAEAGFEQVLYLNDKGMYLLCLPYFAFTALDYNLLNDPSNVEINQKEVHEDNPYVVRRNDHVTTGGDFESVPIQSLFIVLLPRSKLPLLVCLPNLLVPPLIIASVIGVKPVKKETPEVSSEAVMAPDQQVADVLKKLNETKRVVPEKFIPVVDDGKKLKTVSQKKQKGGASKIASHGRGVSVVDDEEAASSKVVEKKKENVGEKMIRLGRRFQRRKQRWLKGRCLAKFRQECVADEAITEELRQRAIQLEEDKKWMIGSGLRRFVTYLLHIQEFNQHLAGIYAKDMAHGRHAGLIAGFDAASKGEAIEKHPAFKPNSLLDFVAAVKEMEALSYPYDEALSRMLLAVGSVKRALFEISDEEDDEAGPSSKKMKVCPDPEPVSTMSIPIDAPPLSSVRVESAFVATGNDEEDDLDGLYDNLPLGKDPLFLNAGAFGSA